MGVRGDDQGLGDPCRQSGVAGRLDELGGQCQCGPRIALSEGEATAGVQGFWRGEVAAGRGGVGEHLIETSDSTGDVTGVSLEDGEPRLGEPAGRRIADELATAYGRVQRDPGIIELAPVVGEVADLGVVPAEEELAVQSFGTPAQLVERTDRP